jgi:hypothetical protein
MNAVIGKCDMCRRIKATCSQCREREEAAFRSRQARALDEHEIRDYERRFDNRWVEGDRDPESAADKFREAAAMKAMSGDDP